MTGKEAGRQPIGRLALWLAVLAPAVLGLALRLAYAVRAGPFVDEPTTLLVAQAIARTGLPILPSGLFYGNDLPFSYLAGAVVAVFGPHLLAVRLLSVAAGAATIALVALAGCRLLSPRVGLWAGLLLALAAQEVLWGGRARAYAVLGLVAWAAVWLFYAGLAGDGGGAGRRRLGLALLVVAVFVHPEAALLLPALVAGAALLRGARWWLRPAHLAELGLAAAGAAARYWLQLALARGWISGLQTVAGSRPPLEAPADLAARLAGVAPFFAGGGWLIWTLLALAALAVALARRSPARRPILFFSACLWLPPAAMVLALGSTYQSPRYLGLLVPIFALLAAAGLDALLGQAGRWLDRLPVAPTRRGPLVAAAVAVLLVAGYAPGALAVPLAREKGFAPALELVAREWRAGDRVASVAPAFSRLVLGRSDLFALGIEYEEFVYRGPDGQLLDRWTGSPLIRTAGELAAALDSGGRLWFVADEGRFRRRFEPDFAQLVWQRMELVARLDDVLVFRSLPPADAAASHPVDAVFGGQMGLAGYVLGTAGNRPAAAGWGEVVARPGEPLALVLDWRAAGPIAGQYSAFLHLIGADGVRYAQADGPPLGGVQPMSHWVAGEVVPDRRTLALPADLPPGRYRLEMGLYAPNGDRLPIATAAGQPLGEALALDFVRVPAPGEALPAPRAAADAELAGGGDRVRLLGYDLEPGGGGRPPAVTLYWQAAGPIGRDYTVFVHLLDGRDTIAGQGDGPPAGGFYPTSRWDPGEVIADRHELRVEPGTPPGTYRLAVGLYVAPDGPRLRAGGEDRVLLPGLEVGP